LLPSAVVAAIMIGTGIATVTATGVMDWGHDRHHEGDRDHSRSRERDGLGAGHVEQPGPLLTLDLLLFRRLIVRDLAERLLESFSVFIAAELARGFNEAIKLRFI
jgi:hypothetical protein